MNALRRFRYRAIAANGALRCGELAATSAADLTQRLRQLDLELISARPALALLRQPPLPRRELIHFCLQLEEMLRAGLPLVDGLRALAASAVAPRLAELFAGLAAAIENGRSLSGALAMHPAAFDRLFVSLVASGESAGELPEVLRRLGDDLKWRDELAAKARQITTYPLFAGGVILLVCAFLFIQVVPQLRSFVAGMGQTPPPSAQLLFFCADALAANWRLLLLGSAALGALFLLWRRYDSAAARRCDALKLRLPLAGPLFVKLALAQFAATLGLLYRAGVPLVEALATAQDCVANRAMRASLVRIGQAISDGRPLAGAFAADAAAGWLFPPLFIRMLQLGEQTGSLERSLAGVSYFYCRDAQESLERAQALTGPLLTVLLGLLLAWVMLAMLGPVYALIGEVAL